MFSLDFQDSTSNGETLSFLILHFTR